MSKTTITIQSEEEFLTHSYPLKEGDIIKEGDYIKMGKSAHWHKISTKFVSKKYQRKLGTLSPEIRRLASNSILFILDMS